jgi:hypothetical protein
MNRFHEITESQQGGMSRMMVEHRSRAAKRNLREGIKKMEGNMSPAAQVRREFRLGRPPKPGESLPLHPKVVWERAYTALSRFRLLMTIEKLEPTHVTAAIVFIELADPGQPRVLLLEEEGKSEEECKQALFDQLGRHDVIALGMIFRQFDAKEKKQATFPYQFTGLSQRGISVLRKAAEIQERYTALIKNMN